MPSLVKNNTTTTPPKPDFKLTELGWIPKDWEVKKLGEIILKDGKYGINAAAVEYSKELPRYLRITDFDEEGNIDESKKVSVNHKDSEKYILQKNDILFARTGASVGKTFLLQNNDNKYVYAGFLIKYSLDTKKVNPYYIFNSCKTEKYNYWVKVISVRSGQPGINSQEYNSLKFPLPPLPEQQAIADCLSTWDEAIEKQTALIQAKQQQHKGLRQLLLTGKKRLTNPKTGKAFDGEWVEKRLGEIGEIFTGGTPSTKVKEYWNGSVIWFTPTEIKKAKKFISNSERKITDIAVKYSTSKLIPENSIIVTTRATIGEVAITMTECTMNQGLKAVKANTTSNFQFLYYILKNSKNDILKKSSGSTFLEISTSDFRKLKINLPNLQEQTAIAEVLETSSNEIQLLQEQLHQLQLQKKGLMQVLLSGALRLRSATTQEKLRSANTQEKLRSANTQEKLRSANTQEKLCSANTQEKLRSATTQEKLGPVKPNSGT